MAEITDSGYPKKDEVIHAGDVGETFADTATWVLVGGPWKEYMEKLVRRNGDEVSTISYIEGSLDSKAPGGVFMSVGTAKSSLQTLANEYHTHTSSNFTELNGWSITESSDKSLVFSVG